MRKKLSVLFESEFELNHKNDKGVYKIYFVNSNEFYIGSTSCTEGFVKRWRDHLQRLRTNKHVNSILQNAYNKYGEFSLKLKIVEICKNDSNYILEREQFYIDTLKPILNVNLTATGCTFPEGWISPTAKPVLQYDLDGNFIREFKSLAEAEKITGCSVKQSLLKVNDYTTRAGIFQWRYKKDNNYLLKIPKYEYKQSMKILCYDSNGTFYKEFPSILSASKELNLKCGNISKTINGLVRSCNGYFFKEKVSDDYPLQINEFLRLHKNQLFVDIEDLETGEKYHFNSLRQIPSELLCRCSIQPYINKGFKEFTFKKRSTNKRFKIKIQSYNEV